VRSLKTEKAARGRLLNSNAMMVDQAAINAGFDFRRYAMKPIPAKPRIITAQVEGSGTAGLMPLEIMLRAFDASVNVDRLG
jgi:hypothetical protein